MIHVGIDDTDTLHTPGTNQLARRIAGALPCGFALVAVLRHQLLFDPRIPYTSKNGCASLLLAAERGHAFAELLGPFERELRAWYVPGSDPGLCVTQDVPAAVTEFGRRCQHEPVAQAGARSLAAEHGIYLEGFGGSEDGVIGALAAVGLLAGGDDGRVIHLPGWRWPDEFAGVQTVAALHARGVYEVRDARSGTAVRRGSVDIGKHLRPSFRGGRVVLFVEPAAAPSDGGEGGAAWRALKLP